MCILYILPYNVSMCVIVLAINNFLQMLGDQAFADGEQGRSQIFHT